MISAALRTIGRPISDDKLSIYLIYVAVGLSLLCTAALFLYLIRKELYQDYRYCRSCDAFDFDEKDACPCCGAVLDRTESFFFLEFDDERATIETLGLRVTKKEPDSASEPARG